MLRELIVAIEILSFATFSSSSLIAKFNFRNFFEKHFFLLFFPIQCNNATFHLSHLFSFFFFFKPFLICGNKLQDIYSIKYISRQIFLPFQLFATLNSLDILILEFSWNLIPVTFSLKVGKTFSRLSRHFLWK